MRKTKYTEPKFIYLKEVTFDKVLGFFVLDVIELHFSYIYMCIFSGKRIRSSHQNNLCPGAGHW